MKKLVLMLALALGSANAFANDSEMVCSATTWNGGVLSVDLITHNGDGSKTPAPQDLQVYLGKGEKGLMGADDLLITTFQNVQSTIKNYSGDDKNPFMLNGIDGKNYRGTASFYWPEQDGADGFTYIYADIKVESLKHPGKYVINVKNLSMKCPN